MKNTVFNNVIEDEKWDRFVENHIYGQCYHTSIWKKVIEKSYKHINSLNLALFKEDNITIDAGIPLYIVKSKILGNRIVCVPFGTLCDPLIDTKEHYDKLIKKTFKIKDDNNCKRVEIKLFQGAEFIDSNRFNVSVTHKHHYLSLNETFEKITKKFKRTVKQAIKKARDSGLTVEESFEKKDLYRFYSLYLMTRKRNYVPAQPFRYFENILCEFGHRNLLSILYVKKKTNTVGAAVLLKFKDRTTLEFLASDTKYLLLRPNHLLTYHAIKNATEQGYKIFDFGRTAPEDNGLMRFKKYWGTTIVDLKQAVNIDAGNNIYDRESFKWKVISYIAGKSPISIYKLLNNFCYRHLG